MCSNKRLPFRGEGRNRKRAPILRKVLPSFLSFHSSHLTIIILFMLFSFDGNEVVR